MSVVPEANVGEFTTEPLQRSPFGQEEPWHQSSQHYFHYDSPLLTGSEMFSVAYCD